MILIGVSWLLFWLLIKVLHQPVALSAIVVAVIFIVLGLIQGERPLNK